MKILIICTLLLSSCTNVTMTCPDKVSTIGYKGLALFGTTSVACVQSPAGGDIAQVSGIDIAALAAMVAPLVLMAHPQKDTAPQPDLRPEPQIEPDSNRNL